jgi:hypothetical protein
VPRPAPTFYESSTDKTDCFTALCEHLGDELYQKLDQYPIGVETPEDGLRALAPGTCGNPSI